MAAEIATHAHLIHSYAHSLWGIGPKCEGGMSTPARECVLCQSLEVLLGMSFVFAGLVVHNEPDNAMLRLGFCTQGLGDELEL